MEWLIAAPHVVGFEHQTGPPGRVTVIVPLYNYAEYVLEALQSVEEQTEEALDLVVVDDASTDAGGLRVSAWMRAKHDRFRRCVLVRHAVNEGLAAARNTAFFLARTPYVFCLDADNILLPRCAERLGETLDQSAAAVAFPLIEVFGEQATVLGCDGWSVDGFAHHNTVDALALVRVEAWRRSGGFHSMERLGWEDYDFWCTLVELGERGVQVPEILARYRVHSGSMLRSHTHRADNLKRVLGLIRLRHPWVHLGRDGCVGPIFSFDAQADESEWSWWEEHLAPPRRNPFIQAVLDPERRQEVYPAEMETVRQILGQAAPLQVLDVGSGPLSALAWGVEQGQLEVTAVDPLAPHYARIMEAQGLRPIVVPAAGAGEQVHLQFGHRRFDVALVRNALDHSISPLRCLEAMVSLLRDGGFLVVGSFLDEGTFSGWSGIHRHDLHPRQGVLFVSDRWGEETALSTRLPLRCLETRFGPEERFFSMIFQKVAA